MTRILARSSTADHLVGLLDVDHAGEAVPAPSWRIEPGQRLAVLVDTLPRRAEGDTEEQVPVRRLESARWGLVPAGSPGPNQAPSLAEVPAEQLGSRPELLQALVSRRAAIPVSGYYEHHETDDGLRTPYLVGAGDGIVLLAALYGWWRDPARAADDPARWVLTCAVLTRPSAGTVEALAERMPVVLSPDVVEAWLDPTAEGSPDLLRAVASQAEDVIEQLAMDEVGPGIDRGAPDTAELARPV
ncbi:SOS response-associated peptidase [Clavibacter michiganensis]|uniref:SOS response-associated peptidase n=1 Tax=Clavibacter michiganensis TaxID=28447 RepID=UPI001D0B5696|nr:SOS response-associated peptidase family protein [Clavibacter michiganensis]MDO4043688.1 SOS response-associated peptidase family protein [Clavibacter michiganensis]MDO4053193.1 SOS response-associated peptidase family protein [Clavibacter michiganensis]MDO4055950.1 SOS response-associated peptidase family protein [Clavibacter michiganensis]MDO4067551.1 SOS response-associated peptidase family protein [Clavibacter michiganensis]UDM12374.1 SOS response-associated peptidase [Clavibacter michi